MGLLDCPHCDKVFRYEGDCEGFDHDTDHEFECPYCEKKFLATAYWDICFTGERKFDGLDNEQGSEK